MTCTLFRLRFINGNVELHSIIAISAYRTRVCDRDPACGIFQILISRSGLKRHCESRKKREITGRGYHGRKREGRQVTRHQ